MTVAATARVVEYLGDGVTTSFPVPFQFRKAEYLQVVKRDVAGIEQVQAPGTAFAVAGGSGGTGTVTFTLPPLATEVVVIRGNATIEQPRSYVEGDTFPAGSHEKALDDMTIALQERQAIERDFRARAPMVPSGELAPALTGLTGATGELLIVEGDQIRPLGKSSFAGKYYAGDAMGRPIPASGTGGGDAALRGDLAEETGAQQVGSRRAGIGTRKRSLSDVVNERRLSLGDVVDLATVDGVTDDADAIQQLVNEGDCFIPARTYAVSRSIRVPAGRIITIEDGARFNWTGAVPNPYDSTQWNSLFELREGDDGVEITSPGKYYLQAPVEMQFLSFVQMLGAQRLSLIGAQCINCTLVNTYPGSDPTIAWEDIVTPEMVLGGDTRAENVPRFGVIRHCSAIFPLHALDNTDPERAGILLYYAHDFEISDCTFRGCYAGVQWWGGNSSFAPGAQGNDPNAERKCKRIRIRNCTMSIGNAGFWGSMGQFVTVDDCEVSDVRDVGIDPEGCWTVRVNRCRVTDAHNGCYSIFAHNRDIVFDGCTAVVYKAAYPVFRIYNSSLSSFENQGVTWINGFAFCYDLGGAATFDAAYGPCREAIICNSDFENVRIDIIGGSHTRIANNTLRFPRRLPLNEPLLSMGGLAANGTGTPLGTIEGNRIVSDVPQPTGTFGIRISGGDFNSSPTSLAVRNIIRVPTTDGSGGGIICEGVDRGNEGAVPNFTAYDNIMDSAVGAMVKGAYGDYFAAGNRDTRGGELTFVAA